MKHPLAWTVLIVAVAFGVVAILIDGQRQRLDSAMGSADSPATSILPVASVAAQSDPTEEDRPMIAESPTGERLPATPSPVTTPFHEEIVEPLPDTTEDIDGFLRAAIPLPGPSRIYVWLNLSIVFDQVGKPTLVGTTGLPEGTELLATVVLDRQMEWRPNYSESEVVTVSGGRFRSMPFTDSRRCLRAGRYVARLELTEDQPYRVVERIGDKGQRIAGEMVRRSPDGTATISLARAFEIQDSPELAAEIASEQERWLNEQKEEIRAEREHQEWLAEAARQRKEQQESLAEAARVALKNPLPPGTGGSAAEAWTIAARHFVRKALVSPSTASFGSIFSEYQDPDKNTTKIGEGRFRCVGWVDSQNRFGAMIRSDFVCVVRHCEDGWHLEDLKFLER